MKKPYSIYTDGDLFTIDEFLDMVDCVAITDDDGSGVFCDGVSEQHERLSCSDIYNGRVIVDPKWTHAVWYNK